MENTDCSRQRADHHRAKGLSIPLSSRPHRKISVVVELLRFHFSALKSDFELLAEAVQGKDLGDEVVHTHPLLPKTVLLQCPPAGSGNIIHGRQCALTR